MPLRRLLAVLLTSSLGLAPISAEHPLVLGYYVPYDSTSWTTLEAQVARLDIIAAQWVTMDACGNLGSRDDQTLKRFVQAHNVKVVPSLFTISGWLNHELLTDDATSAHAIEQIVGYTLDEGYDGFDLDLEGVDPADRPALSQFVQALGGALHDQSKLLTLAIPPKERDTTVGWAGAYDYAALGAQADLVTIMAYEFRGPFSGPGSVAPFDWVQRVAAFASTQIPPEKVLLGLAFYGYDWNTTTGGTRAIGYPQFAALADQYQASVGFDATERSLTFSYQSDPGAPPPPSGPAQTRLAHTITTRPAGACDLTPPPPPPTPTRPPTPPPGTPQLHEVWLEESTSAAARLSLVDHYHLRGISAWRLGLEDPAVWPLFKDGSRGV